MPEVSSSCSSPWPQARRSFWRKKERRQYLERQSLCFSVCSVFTPSFGTAEEKKKTMQQIKKKNCVPRTLKKRGRRHEDDTEKEEDGVPRKERNPRQASLFRVFSVKKRREEIKDDKKKKKLCFSDVCKPCLPSVFLPACLLDPRPLNFLEGGERESEGDFFQFLFFCCLSDSLEEALREAFLHALV